MSPALTVTCNSIVPFRKKETFTILCLRVGPGISACCTFYHRSMEPARLCTRTHGVQSSPVWETRVEMSLLLDLLEILSTSRPVQYAASPKVNAFIVVYHRCLASFQIAGGCRAPRVNTTVGVFLLQTASLNYKSL